MRGNRKRTAKERWQRSHGVKQIYLTKATAQNVAAMISASQPDQPHTAYECYWSEDYRLPSVAVPHYHTGRVMNGRT